MAHFTREEFLCIFTPLPPENGGFSVFLSVIFVLLMYQTQAWRITVRFVFLCFCKRKMEKRFAYTLLNQQMNHLLIIIYIIGTHTCFHKNTKTQKHKNAKERVQNTKLAWRLCRATQHFDDGTSKCKICGVLAENDAFDGGHQHKNSLHPSRRMA